MSTPSRESPDHADLQEFMRVQREAHAITYSASVQAAQSTTGWLLAAATTANSAGFYFAMKAPAHWASLFAAGAFTLALASTFLSGILVVKVHGNQSVASDNIRRMTVLNAEAAGRVYEEAQQASDQADQALNWTSGAAVLFTTLGGALLIAAKVLAGA